MRKLLLNHTPLFRKLRQLSLLLTLLLALPQTAWGDDSTIYNFTGTSDISNKTGTATSNVTGVGERTWTINNFTIFNDQNVIQDITPTAIAGTLGYSNLGYSSYTADFMLESDFGITGAFVSATISYTTNNMSSGEVQVYANDNRPLTTGQGEGGKTIMDLTKTSVTLDLSNNFDKKYFNNNHISFQFTFKPSSADSYFEINSITITTTPVTFYGITVAGTSVRSDNVSNVLNDDFSSVSYNADNNTLTLKNVDLTYGGDNNINATSALTINLVGYNEVGEINVNDGNSVVDLKFTTSETLPGRLKFTNITGNNSILCENGLSWDNTNKYIKSSSTNPHIIYGFGSYNNGDILGYNNEGGMEDLDVSPDVVFTYSTSNTDIKYFKVSSSEKSCYLYPASLDDMNLVTKAYLLFDWGTCTTNNDVTVQIKGLKSDFSNDGTYSLPVSLPSTGGLVEIPLNATINSYYFQLYFSSSSSEFSFIPISVGFQKAGSYGISVAGTAVTSANASAINGTGISGTVSFDATNKILTLNGATIDGTIESSLAILSIHLTGNNSIRGNTTALLNGIKSTNGGTLTFTADANAALTITTTGDAASAITGFANVTMGTGAYLQTNTPTKYDTNGKNFCWQVSSANIVKELTITSTPCYPLWIGNTQFTSTTTPTGFSFDATNNILTLTNVTQADPLISGLANLTIALSGDNSITKSDSSAVIRSINSQAALIIQKAGTGDGSLYLENNGSDPAASPVVKNFASINHTGLNYSSKSGNPINDATTHEAILSSATIYPLWIGNTPVTSTTTSGTGWSYDNNNKKLTLNGGTNTAPTTITGQIISGIGDLTIFLTGTTILKAADSETSLINSTNNGILSFDTNPTAIGSLAFKDNTGSAVFAGEPISGFTSKTYSNGLDYDATTKTIGVTTYDIVVDGQDINSANKTDVMNNGKVTYDSENRILTLNDGTTISSWGINVTSSSDLTVELNGSISVTGSTYAFNTNGGKIIFKKAAEDTSVNLTAKCGLGHHPISFDFITLGSGLYWKPIDSETTVITTDPKFVIVGDYVITDQPVTSTGTITYDTTNKVLTIDRFVKTDNSDPSNDPVPPTYIKSGVVGLTVKLKGNSEIHYSRNANIFEAIGTGATILFDGTEGGDLNMETNSNNQPLSGFAEITYNKLACWNTSDKHHTIQEPIAPEMEEDNNTVKLTKPYTDGSIKYSIDYADDTPDVSNATYSTAFAMTAPGTVTAWVEANNVTTSTVKGKYFGYKDAPFTMLANETKTPELIPAIETGDNIDYAASDPYTSSDAGVATFAGRVITAVAFGNATLTTTLRTSGVAQNVVILNHNKQFETVVKVAKDITGISFSGNAQYSSYCNTDADDLTLPNGIKAYAVKIPTSGNEVVLSEIGFIPGTVNSQNPIYTPILLKRDDTSKTSFGTVTKYVRESGYTLPSNDLKFNTDTQTGKATDGRQYILYKDEFVKATGSINVVCCYLEKPSTNPNPARGFVIEGGDDGSTAIDDTLINEEETGNGEWYDLQGRRIQKPTKAGLYIVNGKKVVVNNK